MAVQMHDLSDLMGLIDVADLCKVSISAVANWRVRNPSFPKPVIIVSHGTPIFSRVEIVEWAVSHNKLL